MVELVGRDKKLAGSGEHLYSRVGCSVQGSGPEQAEAVAVWVCRLTWTIGTWWVEEGVHLEY